MRILYRGQVFESELRSLAECHAFDFVVAADTDAVVRELPQADALWITPSTYAAAIPRAVAARRGTLRWIALTSAGYDAVQIHGIAPEVTTTYAAGVNAPVVAEHALALLLAATRQLSVALDRARSETWDRTIVGTLRSIEDMTVTIVGFGAIGRQLARGLRALGARIIGVNRSGSPDPSADAMVPVAELHAALAQSDAVVIAVTMSEQTRGLIDAAAFDAMRPQTIFVNVARGAIVDQGALRAAIATGKVRGAGLDVTEPEPPPSGDALWRAPETIMTPHVAGFGSHGAGARLIAHFDRNIERFTSGEPLEGVVPANVPANTPL